MWMGTTNQVYEAIGYEPAPGASMIDVFEIVANLYRVVHGGTNTFETGLDEFAILITNLSTADMVLQRVDKLHIADRASHLLDKPGDAVVTHGLSARRPFGSEAGAEPCICYGGSEI
jgi:hypothetical protein